MFGSCDLADRLDERGPRLALPREHAASLSRDFVVAPSPLARLFHPRALDPRALFESVEQRVQRVDVEGELAARARLDQLAQLVAMSRAGVEQREDQQLRRAFLQLAVQGAGVDVCHRQIIYRQTYRSGDRLGTKSCRT